MLKTSLNAGMLILGLMATSASAGTGFLRGAKVTGVYCGYYGGANMCSLYLDQKITYPNSTAPACVPTGTPANEQLRRFQFKLDDVGKAILSLALTAYTSKALVEVRGTGQCTTWPDTENLEVLFILPPGYPSF